VRRRTFSEPVHFDTIEDDLLNRILILPATIQTAPFPVRIDIVDTKIVVLRMSKARSSPSESAGVPNFAFVERSSAAETKGSINLRIEANTRRLIDDAAAILGKTRTEFMIESARRQAIGVLLDQRLFALDSDRYDAFMHALDNPSAPGPKLRSLMRRVPAWRK
jgi:uncharacterized protein (DUF1778 family)